MEAQFYVSISMTCVYIIYVFHSNRCTIWSIHI